MARRVSLSWCHYQFPDGYYSRSIILFSIHSLAMMKEGGKATLVIPSDLAYGDAGSGDTIPPGATLKFEVELFKVQ